MPRPETTDLCRIPGIGKNMEEHLVGLGYYVFFIYLKNFYKILQCHRSIH